jgi:hypothetical protein
MPLTEQMDSNSNVSKTRRQTIAIPSRSASIARDTTNTPPGNELTYVQAGRRFSAPAIAAGAPMPVSRRTSPAPGRGARAEVVPSVLLLTCVSWAGENLSCSDVSVKRTAVVRLPSLLAGNHNGAGAEGWRCGGAMQTGLPSKKPALAFISHLARTRKSRSNCTLPYPYLTSY